MVIKFGEYQLRTGARNQNSLQCPTLFYNALIRYKEKFHTAQCSGSKGLMNRYLHLFSFLQTSNLHEVNQNCFLNITIPCKNLTEISPRSRRDLYCRRDLDEISPRSRRDKRDLAKKTEISSRLTTSRRDLGEICNFSEIATRSRRDERHLGEIKEISPRTLGDFARSR